MRWTEYAVAMLLFSGVSMTVLYLIERTQKWLHSSAEVPQRRTGIGIRHGGVVHDKHQLAGYSGESTMSYLTQWRDWPTTTYFRCRWNCSGDRGDSRHPRARNGQARNFWSIRPLPSMGVLPVCWGR